jgi:ribosomal protein S18 acetylase RimI-like enzyme
VAGGAVAEFDGLVVTLTGLPSRDLNLSFVAGEPNAPRRALEEAEAWCVAHGCPFALDLEEVDHPEVCAAADRAGLRPATVRPAMALELDAFIRAVDPAVNVRRVSTEPDRRQLVQVEAEGSGFDLDTADRLFSPLILADPGLTAYVARLEGKPAGAALIHLDDRAAGVYWVATVPWARRRGVATANLVRALADAKASADFAWLQASTAGRPLYERLGFRWTGDWAVRMRPPD